MRYFSIKFHLLLEAKVDLHYLVMHTLLIEFIFNLMKNYARAREEAVL